VSDGPSIRLASAGPLFFSGGFKLTPRWASFAIAGLTKAQIETLRARVGRWIRIYPADVATLDALLIANPKPPPAPPAPAAIDTNTKAAKVADTKAAKAGKEG
jgi:hypothetical protein